MEENQISTEKAFALLVETASEQFSVLRGLVERKFLFLEAVDDESRNGALNCFRAAACVQMALAKEFLFNSVRAYRILEHGASELKITREQRNCFKATLATIVSTRDVNEHGFDPTKGPRGKESRPTMHHHEADSVLLDETSLVILGSDKILMGPINLADVFKCVESMRKVAGFSASREGDATSTARYAIPVCNPQ